MIYDIEDMLRDLDALYKAKINAQIALINSEKNDSITLVNIESDQFIFMSLDSRMLNFKTPWVQIGLTETPPAQAQEDNYKKNAGIAIEVGMFDDGERDREIQLFKLLRYQKVIEQVLLKNLDVFRGYSKPLIQSLDPAAYPFVNKRVILSAGINIQASITAN